jgi:membrane-associated phospholipid phosphatase
MESQIYLKKKPVLTFSQYVWTKVARSVTNLTSPPFLAIPTFIIFDYHYQVRHGDSYVLLRPPLLLAILFGVILPVVTVLVMRLLGKIDDVHISFRKQRTVPFLWAIASYTLGALVLWLTADGNYLAALLFCYACITLTVMLINFWWKISVHATGLGGPLAGVTLLMGWAVVPLFLLIPLVSWARIYLRAHTLGQVVTGSLFGYGTILFLLLVVFQFPTWI